MANSKVWKWTACDEFNGAERFRTGGLPCEADYLSGDAVRCVLRSITPEHGAGWLPVPSDQLSVTYAEFECTHLDGREMFVTMRSE